MQQDRYGWLWAIVFIMGLTGIYGALFGSLGFGFYAAFIGASVLRSFSAFIIADRILAQEVRERRAIAPGHPSAESKWIRH